MWHLITVIIVLHVQDVKTVFVDIWGAILQYKILSRVILVNGCDELTRGVVDDVVVAVYNCITVWLMERVIVNSW